jgi:hypothetical protein
MIDLVFVFITGIIKYRHQMKKQNITLSEQFQHSIEKSLKEAKIDAPTK